MLRDFPCGPMVKNSPSNAGGASSVPSRGTKIPHASEQLSPYITATEPMLKNLCPATREMPAHCNQRKPVPQPEARAPQWGPSAQRAERARSKKGIILEQGRLGKQEGILVGNRRNKSETED